MTQTPVWVEEPTVTKLHTQLIERYGGLHGVRDHDLLISALSRPLNLFHYTPSASLFELAAAYSYGIARNHPFTDGNKRTAFIASTLFLELNGYRLQSDEDETTEIFQKLAKDDINEKMLSKWFQQHVCPFE